ncbi:hypothetical protein [Roseibium sp.]
MPRPVFFQQRLTGTAGLALVSPVNALGRSYEMDAELGCKPVQMRP